MAITSDEPTPSTLKQPRFEDATASEDAWKALREASRSRRSRIELINANIEGAKPFDEARLKEVGLSANANLNFRDMAAMVDDAVISYYELYHNAPALAEVALKTPHPEADRMETVLSGAYDDFVKERWGDEYYTQFFLFVKSFVAHGFGIAFFPDANSPRWEAVLPENVEFPPLARSHSSKLDYFFVRQPITITDLFLSVADEEAAKKAGWNVSLVKRVLAILYKGRKNNFRLYQAEIDSTWQRLLRNAYGVECEKFDNTISIIHQFSRENSGEITHKVFLEDQKTILRAKTEYLFDNSSHEDLPKDMREVVSIIVNNPGRGYLSTVKGYGDFAHDLTQAITVMRCEMLDRARLADGLVFRNNDSTKTPRLLKTSGCTIIPKELEAIPLQSNTGNTASLVGQLENLKAVNNRRFSANPNLVSQVNTAKQALMLDQGAAKIDLAQGSFFLVQYAQGIMARQFARLRRVGNTDPDAVAFRKYCTDNEVLPEILDSAVISVSTGSAPGASTLQTRLDSALKFIQLSGMPGANPRFGLEMFARGAFGPNAVKRALMPDETQYGDDAQARQAMMENGVFNTNTPLPVDKRDRHDIHLGQHLPPLQSMAKAYAAGEFQLTRDAYLQYRISLEHNKEHLTFLQQDPTRKSAMQQFWPVFQELVGMLKKMESDVQQTAQQTARAQQGQQNQAQAMATLFPSLQEANALGQRPTDLSEASRQDNIAGGVTPDANTTV